MSRHGARAAPALQRAVTALNAPPPPRWTARVLHHGPRFLLLITTAVIVHLFFPAPRVPDAAILERGVVAPQDVIAEFTFHIPKSEAELAREQAEAEAGVPPVFTFVPAAADSVVAGIRGFFAGVDSVLSSTPAEEERAAVRSFMESYRISPTPGAVNLLIQDPWRLQVRRSTERAVRDLLPIGLLPSSALRESFTTAEVHYPDGSQPLLQRDSLLTADRFFGLARQYLPEGAGAAGAELQRLVLIRFFQPSLALHEAETEAARARARAAVEPFKGTVLQGEKIVGAREQIGEREEERLRAYNAALSERGFQLRGQHTTAGAWGAMLYNLLVLSILGLLFYFFRRPLYHDFRAMLLFALLVVAVCGSAALIARFELPAELIPVTFAALIVAVLWEGRLGLVLALLLALLIGGQSPFLGVTAPFTIAIGGAAAAFSVRAAQRRSQTWHFISLITGAYVAAAITMGLMRGRAPVDVFYSMGWGATNAIVASLLAIGFLPLLESFTRITTDQTLLELSDLNRKLLKRLSLEASGTYHHTINVANLAEAACHAIGASGLLARVGAYYHDIGKLVKPQYYIENQPKGRNPHDKLKPAMSASIIRAHVTEGLRLAEQEKLPGVVKQFIAEHHGTQQISFFYDKARELDPEAQPNLADFTYPGPKPQTRETAVVMIADSIESASRVLQDPSPSRIRDLVERIVAGKMAAGQLDECPLTLRDLDIAKEHLVMVLAGMYHQRIDYPPAPAPHAVTMQRLPELPAAGEAEPPGVTVSHG
ncbi:MAG: HDIG domain-containing protein [Gemmatimonadota bacterium]|nr:HDIG domain-containing protein [Gemmatimonadota bacterium]